MTREAPVGGSTASTVEQVPMGSLWYVNPLGFLQLGPIVGAEWALSDVLYVDTHWRYSALGLLYHVLVTGLDPDESLSMTSMGLGGGLKFAIPVPNSNNKVYVGLLAEYGWGGDSGINSSGRKWTAEHTYAAVLGNIGYRWRWPESKFLLNIGLIGGISVDLTNRWWFIDNPTYIYQNPRLVWFLGMLELSMGWEF